MIVLNVKKLVIILLLVFLSGCGDSRLDQISGKYVGVWTSEDGVDTFNIMPRGDHYRIRLRDPITGGSQMIYLIESRSRVTVYLDSQGVQKPPFNMYFVWKDKNTLVGYLDDKKSTFHRQTEL